MDTHKVDKRLEEERKLGYPNFKNRIVELLVNNYQMDILNAKKCVFNSAIENIINNDIIWAQHMGPEYWVELILEKNM